MKLNSIHAVVRATLLPTVLSCTIVSASGAFVISGTNGFFEPSFRGEADTTYFGWATGTIGVNGDAPNGTPSINPGALPGSAFLVQNGPGDVMAGSNNVYGSVDAVNAAQLALNIPTQGAVGASGYTTIIIQGFGDGYWDTFAFGPINGIEADYLYGERADGIGQWWAKWEVPGNQASYTVDILGHDAVDVPFAPVHVTNLIVDTLYSADGFAPDVASIPEPSALLSLGAGCLLLLRRRRA